MCARTYNSNYQYRQWGLLSGRKSIVSFITLNMRNRIASVLF